MSPSPVTAGPSSLTPEACLAALSPVNVTLVQCLLWFALIFALTAGAMAIARRFRARAVHEALDPNDLLTNFRELYEQGGLSDEEFRTIKAKLARELNPEHKSPDAAEAKLAPPARTTGPESHA